MGKKAVLILEDAVFVREIQKKLLKKSDFEIVGETNSQDEGVKLYRELSPDLVLVDLKLAQGTGDDAMRSILEFDSSARFVVVTSSGAGVERDPELKQRVAAVLHKPFTEEEFINTVNGLF